MNIAHIFPASNSFSAALKLSVLDYFTQYFSCRCADAKEQGDERTSRSSQGKIPEFTPRTCAAFSQTLSLRNFTCYYFRIPLAGCCLPRTSRSAHPLSFQAKLAKLRREILDPPKAAGAGKGDGFDVSKIGDARVGLVGFPSGTALLFLLAFRRPSVTQVLLLCFSGQLSVRNAPDDQHYHTTLKQTYPLATNNVIIFKRSYNLLLC